MLIIRRAPENAAAGGDPSWWIRPCSSVFVGRIRAVHHAHTRGEDVAPAAAPGVELQGVLAGLALHRLRDGQRGPEASARGRPQADQWWGWAEAEAPVAACSAGVSVFMDSA